MQGLAENLLQSAINHLKSFESDAIARLTRVEENLRLLRNELLGEGQPGRISKVEADVSMLRAEYQRQRGVFAAISFVVSVGIAILSRLFHR